MREKYEAIIQAVKQNVRYQKEYGVPYEPPKIGYAQRKIVGVASHLSRQSKQIDACRKCSLGEERCQRKRFCVPGGGNPRSKLMVVGEGPGKQEERYTGEESPKGIGFPFVGASGDELNRIIESLGFQREDVFITNVLHCRATERDEKYKLVDRKPKLSEIRECLPYLKQQIKLVQPWIILAFGAFAGSSLLELPYETSVASMKDCLHDYPDDPRIKVWVTYHPAYLLRNESEKISVGLGLKHLRAIMLRSGMIEK